MVVPPSKRDQLGLVGSIQHLHLLPKYKMLERAGFEVEIPTGGDELTFPGRFSVAIILVITKI